jgi:hypothetical protein
MRIEQTHMVKKDVFTTILAMAGTALVWLPVLAPVLFSVAAVIQERTFRFDYLMPAELFPVVLVGGCLLIWSALRARLRRRLIGWSFAIAVALLVGGQVLAAVTGLASGETEPAGWWWGIVLGSIVAYSLSLAAIGVGGLSLLRDLLKAPRTPAEDH